MIANGRRGATRAGIRGSGIRSCRSSPPGEAGGLVFCRLLRPSGFSLHLVSLDVADFPTCKKSGRPALENRKTRPITAQGGPSPDATRCWPADCSWTGPRPTSGRSGWRQASTLCGCHRSRLSSPAARVAPRLFEISPVGDHPNEDGPGARLTPAQSTRGLPGSRRAARSCSESRFGTLIGAKLARFQCVPHNRHRPNGDREVFGRRGLIGKIAAI
jgi:hypothetical protein